MTHYHYGKDEIGIYAHDHSGGHRTHFHKYHEGYGRTLRSLSVNRVRPSLRASVRKEARFWEKRLKESEALRIKRMGEYY